MGDQTIDVLVELLTRPTDERVGVARMLRTAADAASDTPFAAELAGRCRYIADLLDVWPA